MLQTLEVRDFVLIEHLVLELEPGFNVITGETGAGKSIIIGALQLVLGGRARADMVRRGAHQATVEAQFDLSPQFDLSRSGDETHGLRWREKLEALGVAIDGELVVRRVVTAAGRSRAYVNGRLCTVQQLQSLAVELADVTSQHESVALADARRHVDYLDAYGQLMDARAGVAALVDELVDVQSRLESLVARERTRVDREGFVRYQLEAIDKVDPQPGERRSLEAELGRLKHVARLAELSRHVAAVIEGGLADGGDDTTALVDQVGRLVGALGEAAALDPSVAPIATELDELWTRLREVGRDTARYAERLEADPDRLDAVQARTFALDRLQRQHGPTLADVLDTRQRLADELEQLASAETERPQLERRRDALRADGAARAERLSRHRKREAKRLSQAISQQLGALGMGEARVTVSVDPSDLSRTGIDRVQFLIAPNRGEDPRPLGRIASGGELSRALLALKRALCVDPAPADARPGSVRAPRVGIQVLDEVDTGVGGETADKIGAAIAAIARQRQVLCITHLASIAAYADAHFVVRKQSSTKTTTSAITKVDRKRRAEELARMLTGARATKNSLAAARDLLRASAA
ncbi:MAG: DNA repair protein RecN [Myxococcota bacterium]